MEVGEGGHLDERVEHLGEFLVGVPVTRVDPAVLVVELGEGVEVEVEVEVELKLEVEGERRG